MPWEPLYWRTQQEWAGEACVIVGNGPSASAAMADGAAILRLRSLGFRFIAVNEAYRLCPWADLLYFCDAWFFETVREREDFKHHPGMKVTLDPAVQKRDRSVRLLENAGKSTDARNLPPLIKEPGVVNHGRNSGYQAISLAYLLGVRLILLAGYDMRQVGDATHWSSECLGAQVGESPRRYEERFLPMFEPLARALRDEGVSVINCTPSSALTCFPTARL